MDQLHRAHDNGRAANSPAQSRDLTEDRTAQINDVKNMTHADGGQGTRGA
jgi:hypothetical protein